LVCTLSGGLWPVRMRWPAARTPGCGFGGGVQRPVPAVALPLCGIGGATASLLVCRAGARRERRAPPAAQCLLPTSHPQAGGAAATPRSRPPTPDPQPPHRKGHRHEPRRLPAAISDPLASRQRTANLGQRSQLSSPSNAPPAPLPQATPPRPSNPAEPHRLRLGSRRPWKAIETSANHGLAPTSSRRKRQQPDLIPARFR